MDKVIIEAAINGAVAKKTLNPNIAYSPREIADDAIATCEAGAALVHFHARDPQTGKFVFEHGELYTEVYRRARARSKVLFWPGSDFMAMRKGDPDNPDLLFCDPGSVNLVSYILRPSGFVTKQRSIVSPSRPPAASSRKSSNWGCARRSRCSIPPMRARLCCSLSKVC